MAAAYHGRLDWVARLLKEDSVVSSVNAADSEGITALMHAAVQNHGNVVEALLGVPGINVNRRNMEGKTACQIALQEGAWEAVEKLVSASRMDVQL